MKSDAIALIVDDSATNIQIIAACLKQHYRLKVATSGEQCLLLAEKTPQPDIILLDIEMPGMDGYETCKALKNNPKTQHIPVIFVTGKIGDSEEEKGLSLGAVDYITKPINPPITLARVKTHIMLKKQRDTLEKLALHDQLTGLYNRHYLFDVAEKKMANIIRHGGTISLLAIDIDHFKQINDQYGHQLGDKVLVKVAELLNTNNRTEDITARIGGEEFVILLEHCKAKEAFAIANQIKQAIELARPFDINVTVSIGVSDSTSHTEFSTVLKAADDALYQAKNLGRNRVEIA
jgi:diguanylate cyclase (GGDEF)-like protein